MSITPRDPADFTPTRGNYTELKPFRFWCQKVLPLVYDDSLSYYELLCKVVDFLNKTMEDVETLEGDVTGLHEAYVELQTYVNEYFSTLDVQEEINNKLDEMAENGELSALIAPLLPDLIAEWLTEHITPTTPIIDNTLRISGAGADSKTVGDLLFPINDIIQRNIIYSAWNVAKDGIYIDGDTIVVNENGFCIYTRKGVYYIAPIDRTTVTRFTPSESNPFVLLLDFNGLTNANGRNNPEDVLSISTLQKFDETRYRVVAVFYRNYWKFVNEFSYLNTTDTTLTQANKSADAKAVGDLLIPVSEIVNKNIVYTVWNVAKGGIYIDGNSIVVNENGFGIYTRNGIYYIAPTDLQTISTFTAPDANPYALIMDTESLTNVNARNNPNDVLSVSTLQNFDETRYKVVALYYGGNWNFINEFSYFNTPIINRLENISKRDTIYSIWNVKRNGIVISGDDIIVNGDGFAIYNQTGTYYIAPLDGTTITTFTAPTVGGTYALVIDNRLVTNNGGRNEPNDVLSVKQLTNYNQENYTVVALYYKGYWKFVNQFSYFNQDGSEINAIFSTWNSVIGGVVIDNENIIVNKNGFVIFCKRGIYYIAPTDLASTTIFTPVSLTSTYALVIDFDALTNHNARNEPSSVLSIKEFSRYDESRYAVMAVFFKGYWKFVGKFSYFNKEKELVASPVFAETHLIAHKGGNTYEANTIQNFQNAINEGYKIVEADIRFTSDNVPVLSHDGSFVVGGTTYTISSNTYDTLVAVKPNLATLEELFLLCKRNNIVAELDFTKNYSNAQSLIVVNLIKKHQMQGKCFVTCYQNTARFILQHTQNIILSISGTSTVANVEEVKDIIYLAKLVICSVESNVITDALLEAIHNAGALAKVWTVNSSSDINDLFESGVEYIITDSVTP